MASSVGLVLVLYRFIKVKTRRYHIYYILLAVTSKVLVDLDFQLVAR